MFHFIVFSHCQCQQGNGVELQHIYPKISVFFAHYLLGFWNLFLIQGWHLSDFQLLYFFLFHFILT